MAYFIEVFDNDAVTGPKSARTETFLVRLPSLEEVLSDVAESHEQSMQSMQDIAREIELIAGVRKAREEAARGEGVSPERAKQLLAQAGYPTGIDVELQTPVGRYTQDKQAAEAIGRSRSATTNLLRLLALAEPVQTMLLAGDIEMGHARALLALPAARQTMAASEIHARRLSVRDAERLAALDMIGPWADRPRAITLGTDRGYDAADFVEELRTMNVRPHVAQNTSGRSSATGNRRSSRTCSRTSPTAPVAPTIGVSFFSHW